jgi:hypothetical protein
MKESEKRAKKSNARHAEKKEAGAEAAEPADDTREKFVREDAKARSRATAEVAAEAAAVSSVSEAAEEVSAEAEVRVSNDEPRPEISHEDAKARRGWTAVWEASRRDVCEKQWC